MQYESIFFFMAFSIEKETHLLSISLMVKIIYQKIDFHTWQSICNNVIIFRGVLYEVLE